MLTKKERQKRQISREKERKRKQILREKEKKRKQILREKEKKRKQIFRVALHLFQKKGLENTMIEDIALRAKIGKGTFYNFFESKEDVLQYYFDREFERSNKQVERILSSKKNFLEQLGLILSIYWENMYQNRDFARIIVKDIIIKWGIFERENALRLYNQNRFNSLLSQLIELGKKRNDISKHIDSKRLLHIILALNTMYMMFWLNGAIESQKECLAQLKEDMKILYDLAPIWKQ